MQWEHARLFTEAVISIFAIVNPIGALPVLVAMTEDAAPQRRQKFLRLAGMAALLIICTMALIGQFLLKKVFQIGLSEFAFGGGLVLVVIGIRHLLGGTEARKDIAQDDSQTLAFAVSPIASPLLVGPGSIVNVILLVNAYGRIFALAACLVAFVFVILVLNYTHIIYRLMGKLGSLAIGRVMEIFIVALGVKFCFQAIADIFPGLVH